MRRILCPKVEISSFNKLFSHLFFIFFDSQGKRDIKAYLGIQNFQYEKRKYRIQLD